MQTPDCNSWEPVRTEHALVTGVARRRGRALALNGAPGTPGLAVDGVREF